MTGLGQQPDPVDRARGEALYGPLTDSVRRLIDATIRSEVDEEAIGVARALIDEASNLLATQLIPGARGVQRTLDGGTVAWGNAAIGLRNAIAPPLVLTHTRDGVYTDIDLGAAYEGPPGHVHGGVCALILDHILGATAHQPGRPAFTGTITLRYLRPTRLGRLHAEAHVDRVEGVKTYAVGHISDAQGVTVEAEGVFIRPNPR
ncbi:MAG: PaaI family thioesterase [Mycobacterium sp.]|nr:MAG: PaaI family thioesterase [Mycobacterium sp.]